MTWMATQVRIVARTGIVVAESNSNAFACGYSISNALNLRAISFSARCCPYCSGAALCQISLKFLLLKGNTLWYAINGDAYLLRVRSSLNLKAKSSAETVIHISCRFI